MYTSFGLHVISDHQIPQLYHHYLRCLPLPIELVIGGMLAIDVGHAPMVALIHSDASLQVYLLLSSSSFLSVLKKATLSLILFEVNYLQGKHVSLMSCN